MNHTIDTLIATANKYLGTKEKSANHQKIIDSYNEIDPLPRGYRMTISDPWCAAFISSISHMCDMESVVFPECSCTMMLAKYASAGQFIEDDAYEPKPGDLLFYSWSDDGIGDCTANPDHVGLVMNVNYSDGRFATIEGNRSHEVKVVHHTIDEIGIRGFAHPNYPDYDWKKEKIAAKTWMLYKGFILGDENGFVEWTRNITLEELSVLLYRLYEG